MQPNIIAIVDVETAGEINRPLIYDFAYRIVNKKGEVLAQHNALVQEIITNPSLMIRAYYHRKIYNSYIPMLDRGEVHLSTWGAIRLKFLTDCKKHNVNIISAYNLPFDSRAIRATQNKIAYGKFLNFTPKQLCLWRWACLVLFDTPAYKEIAQRKRWVSEAGNYRTTAEHAQKFITNDPHFIEAHTAAEDVKIETNIMRACYARKKRVPYNEVGMATWQVPNRKNHKSIKQGQMFNE